MWTSFHHQPEAQHPKSISFPQAGRPITPSFWGTPDSLCSPQAFPSLDLHLIVRRRTTLVANEAKRT